MLVAVDFFLSSDFLLRPPSILKNIMYMEEKKKIKKVILQHGSKYLNG